jgi:hypothetical protein
MEPKVVRITNLKEGENHIEISATNDGPSPAGLLISLAVREDERRVKHIVSSSAWSAKVAGAKWKPAADLGKYGSAPWGEKIQEKVSPGGVGNKALYLALSKPKLKRSKADWKTSTMLLLLYRDHSKSTSIS